jgi:hydrogenase-4 component E
MLLVLLATLVLINLHMLGASRLGSLIRNVGLQAIIISVMAILVIPGERLWHFWVITGLSILVKGVLLPKLMKYALRESNTRREVEPYVSYPVSILLGLFFLGSCLWISHILPLESISIPPLALGISLFTICVGLFLIVSRSKAITQTIGYLSMENGIYATGLILSFSQSFIVEMGVLLDVFVGVFVMGILVFHINREFDHIDIHLLSNLKD